MNMNVLALMFAIAAGFVGLLGYGLVQGKPLLMLALAAIAGLAFAPWHKSP